MIAKRYGSRSEFFGEPADSRRRDVLERAIEVPVAQFAWIRLDDGRLMPTYVVSVIAAAVIVVLAGSVVVVTVRRAPIVMTMDVRPIPSAVAMVDRAHDSAPKLDGLGENRKQNLSINYGSGKRRPGRPAFLR